MEKAITNADVLYHIFKYLNFEDHINLSKVCKQFRTVIADCIFKDHCKELEVYKTTQNTTPHYILSNYEINDLKFTNDFEIINKFNTICYNKDDCYGFVQLIGCDIRKLTVTSTIKDTEKNCCHPMEFGGVFDNFHRFRNLVSITYKSVIIGEDDFKVVTKYCTKLEKLCLDNCYNINKNPLVIGDKIKVATLQDISSLTTLELYAKPHKFHYKFTQILEILTNLKLKKLAINVQFSSMFQDDIVAKELATSCLCKELTMGLFPCQSTFNEFNTVILSNFNNLQKLTLIARQAILIDETFFNTLSKHCTKLKFLKLQNFKIRNFQPLHTLTDLVLEDCIGLIWQDFKQILNVMKLKSFSAINVKNSSTEDDTFEYFNVAPTLEHLQLKRVHGDYFFDDIFDVEDDTRNLNNFTSLIWWSNYTPKPYYIPLGCVKLKKLIVEPCDVLINSLHNLKFLEELVFTRFENINSSIMRGIFKHPTLKHFTVLKLVGERTFFSPSYESEEEDTIFGSYTDRVHKTNLLFINIPLNDVFDDTKRFWYILLCGNENLRFMLRYDIAKNEDYGFLKDIIKDLDCYTYVKERVMPIKICGQSFDFNELKDNFDATIQKVKLLSKQYVLTNQEGYILL